MEAGWVQDSFEKNDMKIDRAYKTMMAVVYEKHVPEDDCRDIQLDIYKKNLTGSSSLFRMIVALEDMNKKTIQVVDGYVKVQDMDFAFDSLSFATSQPLNLTNDMTNSIKQSFQVTNETLKATAFAFSKPLQEKFELIKVNGSESKTYLVKEEKNGSFTEIFSFNY